VGPAH